MIKRPECFFFVAIMISSLLACASDRRWPSFDIEINDRPDEEKFYITLKSHDHRYLCLDSEAWPNRLGQLHMGGAVVEASSGVYEAESYNFGYCPGGCEVFRIPPGGKLDGFISYDVFGDMVGADKLSDKHLIFSASPYPCEG